jgi:subtilisin family serine protease
MKALGLRKMASRVMRAGLVTVLLLGILPLGAVSAVEDSTPKVAPKVQEELANSGLTSFWVHLTEKADLSAASSERDWDARGQRVYDLLTTTASASQQRLIEVLKKEGASFQSFWVNNSVLVKNEDVQTLNRVIELPVVEKVTEDGRIELPPLLPSETDVSPDVPQPNDIRWNISQVRADQVWSDFNVRGEEIVVANIDSGVEFSHPALANQYRGKNGTVFDHNYNWYDPSQICGTPSNAPCDNNGHGTHTMGTMVGSDLAGANQIGVAPGSRWIAAKGCEYNWCSYGALIASGQWLLAPTDLLGRNPRPDLRPHVVNNSWGGAGGRRFYESIIDAWIASGIFPAFANGNSGSLCLSSGSPGDNIQAYSAGASDISGRIASFSSRGPSSFSIETKPNITAPGVNVISSYPGSTYAAFSGTSMASPHVAGTVALIWSAAPGVAGDIAATRSFLDGSATDTLDLSCGGTLGDNNVWGEGKLDAYAAVSASPRIPQGTLEGVVTNGSTGRTIEGATVSVAGPMNRSTNTDEQGRYSMRLSTGSYQLTASAFGYQTATHGLTVSQGQTTALDLILTPMPNSRVSGRITSNGSAMSGATVTIEETPIAPATTDSQGNYSFATVPHGEYNINARSSLRCSSGASQLVSVNGDEAVNFELPRRTDAAGYGCSTSTQTFIPGDTTLPLWGDDATHQVTLPFSFTLYGQSYTSAWVSTNGLVSFTGSDSSFSNGSIPNIDRPNGTIYSYWDDLYVDSEASIHTKTLLSEGKFVIEWRNLRFYADATRRITFEVILNQNGRISTLYNEIASDEMEKGGSATVGLENDSGTVAFQYSSNEPVLTSGLGIDFAGDVTAPETTITAAPSTLTNSTSGTFSFTSNEEGSTFECRLDGAPFASCSSPKTYSALSDGTHIFEVMARDVAGNIDPIPASNTWTVDSTAPAQPALISPADGTSTGNARPTFDWNDVTDPSGVTYQIQIDNSGSGFPSPEINQSSLSTSSFTPSSSLPIGTYSWRVRASDGAGNIAWSAVWTVTVSTPPGAIAGKVTNQSKQGIAGATVNCGTAGSATTASDGTYSITSVAPGSYTCTASASGFKSVSKSVTVSSNSTSTASFALRKA